MPDSLGPNTSRVVSRIAVLVPSLGRDNDNEVVAAVRAIGASLKAEKLDFHDLARALAGLGKREEAPPVQPQPWSPSPTPPGSGTWYARYSAQEANSDRERAAWLNAYGDLHLTERERDFVRDLAGRLARYGGRATPRQADWLESLFDRVARAAA